MKINQTVHTGTSQIIRSAENLIQERQYQQAMDQLTAAQRLDPENIYINAIIERFHHLAANESSGGRLLTLGYDFGSTAQPPGESQRLGEDLETRIKKLTSKASDLVRRGAYETAFDSLMNAYLLDPVSPVVMETERTLLPAIEMMRKRGMIKDERPSETRKESTPLPPSGKRSEPPRTSSQDARRIEELKRQKEVERLDRERNMWREASSPPRLVDYPLPSAPSPETAEPEPTPPPAPEKEPVGFFAKLRLGKFLG